MKKSNNFLSFIKTEITEKTSAIPPITCEIIKYVIIFYTTFLKNNQEFEVLFAFFSFIA